MDPRMDKYSVRRIRSGKFNSRRVKFFELWKEDGGAVVFMGHFIAPLRTASQRLIEVAIDWMEDAE